MPTSHPGQIGSIVSLMMLARPGSLLDIGFGFGKYGFLAREYLELWDGGQDYGSRRVRIEGVEAFPGYVTELQRLIYDEIHIGDALVVLPGLARRYDLLILVDVLEHFGLEDGMRLLALCRERADSILVSVPREVKPQGAAFGNEYETHRFQWTRAHLRLLRPLFEVPDAESLLLFCGAKAPELAGALGLALEK